MAAREGKWVRIAAGLAAAWILAGAACVAQTGGAAAPTIQVYSRETVVDVTVTDKDGNPVRGLTQDDFVVSEDGKPQTIRSFKESRTDLRAASRVERKLPANVYSNVHPAPVGAANIILLDELNVDMKDQMRSRQQALEYLKGMSPGTEVALLSLSNRLRLLQGFTSDSDLLITAIGDPKNSMLQPASVGVMPRCDAQDLKNRMTLEGLREIAAMMSGTKGRKNLVWFSVGMQSVIFAPPMLDPPMPCLPDYTQDLHKAYAMLGAAQVAVYLVDPRGLQESRRQYQLDFLSMEAVAEATGGKAFYNTNDLTSAVAKAVDGGANYYTLSYVPPGQQYDGKHHTIHVKVERPGAQLVYRDEYYAEDPTKVQHEPVPVTLATVTPAPDANTMRESMGRFAPEAAQMRFDVKVTLTPADTPPKPTDPPVMGVPAAEFKGKPMVRYDLLYSMPAQQIAFKDSGDGAYHGALEFDVVASDVFGKLITSVSRTLPLTLSEVEYDEFVQTPFQFFQQIDLPAGQTYLRVGVLDKNSNKVGTVEVPLNVAKGNAVAAR